jgi:hypothetical protein
VRAKLKEEGYRGGDTCFVVAFWTTKKAEEGRFLLAGWKRKISKVETQEKG